MPKKAKTMLNPGSPEAVALGCTCPVMDNHNGVGYCGVGHVHIVCNGCPLHSFRHKSNTVRSDTHESPT